MQRFIFPSRPVPRHTLWVNSTAAPQTPLTRDEERVRQLLVEGRTGEEIVATLGISRHTFRQHVQSILVKFQVHSRLELTVRWARLNPEPPPLPPAASAALPVPMQYPEDVPTHVGKPLRRNSGRFRRGV